MSRFLFAATRTDLEALLKIWLERSDLRFVQSYAVDGSPVFFRHLPAGFWEDVRLSESFYLSGAFTVDLQVFGKSVIQERSGPILYLRLPKVYAGGLRWREQDVPRGPVELVAGYLHCWNQWSFTTPKGREGNPRQEVESTYRELVASAKRLLVRRERKWVGRQGSAWIEAGNATYRPCGWSPEVASKFA